MQYYICGLSDTGNYRKKNEDCLLINKNIINNGFYEATVSSPLISGVCDGVGSEKKGEVASHLALKALSELDFSSYTDMNEYITNIHNKIIAYSELSPLENRNMQTTLCCLTIDENDCPCCINVGDSRMYRYCDGNLTQISTDQSLVQFLHSTGKITEEEKSTHEKRHVIFPVLGNAKYSPLIQFKPMRMKISGNDIILICSDGVTDYVTYDELDICMSLDLSLAERIEALKELATDRGSTDNITIVALKGIYEPKG